MSQIKLIVKFHAMLLASILEYCKEFYYEKYYRNQSMNLKPPYLLFFWFQFYLNLHKNIINH